MTTTEIKQQLCIYDKRNPYNDTDQPEKINGQICNCDSCYYGKHQLASELLRVKSELIELRAVYFDER